MSTIDGLTIEERGGPERLCTGRHTVDGHPVTCTEVALDADFCPSCSESSWAARLAAAEERAREEQRKDHGVICTLATQRDDLASALRQCASAAGNRDAAQACRLVIQIARAALAPPPEAEKKGGNDGK